MDTSNLALSHNDVLSRHTGWQLDPELWQERRERSKLVHQQTAELADRLEAMGIRARLESDLTAIGAVTGRMDMLDSYRPIRFLPAVAQRDRRPTLNGLAYWLKSHPGGRYARYAVVTYGQPLVPCKDDLGEAIKDLTKRISRWAADVKKNYGIEVLYRGVEYTLKDRDGSGVETLHLHANVLYWPHRVLKESDWAGFLSFSRQRLAAHWKDCGKVEDPSEIVKYVIKPEELKGASDDVLRWLYEGSFGRRISAPMGSFREFMAGLKEAGEKVVSVSGAGLRRVRKARRLDHSKRPEDRPQSGREARNIILGITLPQWRFSPWAEPMILVQNYEPNAVGTAAQVFDEDMQALRWEARMDWDKSGAPAPEAALAVAEAWEAGAMNVKPLKKRAPYRVHTCSVTAQTGIDVEQEAAASGGPFLGNPPCGATPLRLSTQDGAPLLDLSQCNPRNRLRRRTG